MTSIEKVAINNGITREEVEREINLAIKTAMSNPDPQIQKLWRNLTVYDRVPTGQEVTDIIATHILKVGVLYKTT